MSTDEVLLYKLSVTSYKEMFGLSLRCKNTCVRGVRYGNPPLFKLFQIGEVSQLDNKRTMESNKIDVQEVPEAN